MLGQGKGADMYKLAHLFITLSFLLIVPAETAGAGGKDGPHPANRGGIFNSFEFKSTRLATVPKWVWVLLKMKKQKEILTGCAANNRSCPPVVAKSWKQIIRSAKHLSKANQLIVVNIFFNRWPYKLDMSIFNIAEYWATPIEFMKLSGDCEDYSIAKFYALLELGWDNDDMRIVALVNSISGTGHAVLAVRFGGDYLVLDNTTNLVMSHLIYKHYVPHFSINETTKWSHAKMIKETLNLERPIAGVSF